MFCFHGPDSRVSCRSFEVNRLSVTPCFSSRFRRFPSAVLAVALIGFGQSASADAYRSWSYLTQPDGEFLSDGHSWSADPALWQPGSAVRYDDDNFARSMIGIGSDGRLEAKMAVSAAAPVRGKVYSEAYFVDDGFTCEGATCGSAVPLSAAFNVRLRQDGRFTLGSANYSVSYSLWTAGTFFNFHFAVQQGEMELEPYGWFSRENLVSGAMTSEAIASRDSSGNVSFNPLFNLVWEDDDQDGVYNFAYDLGFDAYTQGADLKEELHMAAFAYGSTGGDAQFVDSYDSFRSTWVPEAGVTLSGTSGRFAAGPVTPPVPEPSRWAAFLAGLALVSIFVRPRRPVA